MSRAGALLPLLAWGIVLLLAMIPSPVQAQDPADPAPPDTAVADTVAPDTLAAVPAAPDTVIDRLLQLPGYTAVEYQGTRAEFRTDSAVLRLEGEAQVVREGDQLTADTITFFQDRELVRAVGEPTVSGQQAQEITGNVLWYDFGRRRAVVEEARTAITEGATWYVRGDVTTEGSQRIYGEGSTFTSDDRPEPQYHFEAGEITVIRDRILVARPVVLYFRNVPVFPLPFIVQDLESGRRSGLLTPRFSINDIVRSSSGYTRQIENVGFYWAINDYLGAQIATGWRSDSYTSLDAALQYRWRDRFLNGNVNVRRFWQANGSKQLNLSTSNSWRPDERTSISLSGSYATNSSFVRDLSTDPREVTQDLNSTFSLDRRFDWGAVNIGGRRSQSILSGEVRSQLPSIRINVNPITLFRAPRDQAHWYNNASFNIGASGSRSSISAGADSRSRTRGIRDGETIELSANQSLNIGDLSLSSNASFNQTTEAALDEFGTFPALAAGEEGDANWSSSLSYRIPLVGNTFITPNVNISQAFRRDSLSASLASGYVAGPMRFSLGTGITPNLYGFFPGIGPYSGIRHKITPSISYSYSPGVMHTPLQDSVFGTTTRDAQNVVSLSLTQTFEAKLRAPERPPEEADTAAVADTAGAVLDDAVPAEPEKVQVLGITTSAIGYDFAKAARGESGFRGETVTNTIRSDYFNGLTFNFAHDLFDASGLDRTNPEERGQLGRFAPHLSSVNTSFSFGQGSALFRWIGGLLGGGETDVARVDSADFTTDDAVTEGGVIPGTPPPAQANPPGTTSFTDNPQAVGSGPWNVNLSYSLLRPRPVQTDEGERTRFAREASQTVDANISFSPTPNWSVNWNTGYSITDGEFANHSLRLRRNLYRWEADFAFTRTVTGNSSFSVTVRLIDLPDLKVDYRERDLGGDVTPGSQP